MYLWCDFMHPWETPSRQITGEITNCPSGLHCPNNGINAVFTWFERRAKQDCNS